MAGIALVAGGDMEYRFTGSNHTVMATDAGAHDLGMVHRCRLNG